MRITRSVALGLVGFTLFLIAATYITYPLAFHMGDLVTGYGDEFVITWIQNWVIHALSTNPFGLFDTNLFYPYQGTLAYSDLHFTSSILSIIPLHIIGQPIATFNFTVLSSIILVPFSLFLLSWFLTKDYFASMLSGFLVQFSPVFLDKKVHIQILAVEWVPLSVLLFILFFKRKKTWYLALSMLFFLLQTYNNFMSGYFLLFFYLAYIFYFYLYDRVTLATLLRRSAIGVIVVTAIFLLPVILPYYKLSVEYHAERDIRDAIHFAIQPEDMLYPNEYTRLQPLLLASSKAQKYPSNAELKPGYLGFVFSLLFLIAVVYLFKTKPQSRPPFFNVLCISALIGLVLSLGPLLHFNRVTIHKPFPIPLPYALLYYIAPGFQGFRNSARWEIMFILFLSVAIALMLAHILNRPAPLWRRSIYLLLILGVIAEYNYPMKFYHVPQKKEFPPIYRWLATTPKSDTSIIMPIYYWRLYGAAEEFKRDYYTTIEWRKMVNGSSGWAPPQWEHLVAKLHIHFPDKIAIQDLKALGVNYIIVDKGAYDREFRIKQQPYNGEYVINRLKHTSSLRLIKIFGKYFIFEFTGHNEPGKAV